jgi:hypothetical protein
MAEAVEGWHRTTGAPWCRRLTTWQQSCYISMHRKMAGGQGSSFDEAGKVVSLAHPATRSGFGSWCFRAPTLVFSPNCSVSCVRGFCLIYLYQIAYNFLHRLRADAEPIQGTACSSTTSIDSNREPSIMQRKSMASNTSRADRCMVTRFPLP